MPTTILPLLSCLLCLPFGVLLGLLMRFRWVLLPLLGGPGTVLAAVWVVLLGFKLAIGDPIEVGSEGGPSSLSDVLSLGGVWVGCATAMGGLSYGLTRGAMRSLFRLSGRP